MLDSVALLARDLPAGALPGMDPNALIFTAFELAAVLGMSKRAMDRLIGRHKKELRNYGPLFEGARERNEDGVSFAVNYFLLRDQAHGAVAELVGIAGGVVSGVLNPDIAGVGAPA